MKSLKKWSPYGAPLFSNFRLSSSLFVTLYPIRAHAEWWALVGPSSLFILSAIRGEWWALTGRSYLFVQPETACAESLVSRLFRFNQWLLGRGFQESFIWFLGIAFLIGRRVINYYRSFEESFIWFLGIVSLIGRRVVENYHTTNIEELF